MSDRQQQAMRELYLQRMGIDVWVPRYLERVPASAAEVAAAPVEAAAAPVAAEPPAVAESPAFEQAAAAPAPAAGWDELAAQVAGCERCALRAGCSQTVFGVGDRRASLMVVGEGPGAEEDRLGEPFVGRAGGLLNNMLRAIGLAREAVFIANIVKCRPPNNRDPLPEEMAACAPYLQRQIDLLRPRAILAVGRIAAQALLQTQAPLGSLREGVHAYGAERLPVVVTYHPAYLLRSPREKAKAWQDLRRVRAVIQQA